MTASRTDNTRPGRFLRDSAVTLAALLLTAAAFDDITTGSEPDFRLEYGVLVAGISPPAAK